MSIVSCRFVASPQRLRASSASNIYKVSCELPGCHATDAARRSGGLPNVALAFQAMPIG
jgi:hypothetical protein